MYMYTPISQHSLAESITSNVCIRYRPTYITTLFISLYIAESRGPLEPNDYPTCPAVEIDTCSEECESHSNCTATQLCCRGCGSTCREAVNLPYYKVPLTCPPQVVALSDESDVCDVECLSDSQCSGDRVCCRSGCSSSCQVGMMPPEPCHIVRQLIEGMDDRDDEDDEDGGTNNGGGPALVGQFVPGCLEEGYFNPVQIWENNGWCVDVVTGKPISVAYTLSDDPVISCPSKKQCAGISTVVCALSLTPNTLWPSS